jgi:hypothetical protein
VTKTNLFLEVSDGVVIGVGEEVHALRGGFDVVFEVVHQVRTVTLRARKSVSASKRKRKKGRKRRTLTCSVPVMAQNTISANF